MRLVVVSNRSPFLPCPSSGMRSTPAVGGVAGALRQVLSRTGGSWVGWDGWFRKDAPSPDLSHQPQAYALRPLRLSHNEVGDYYLGFSNRVLWPICHSFPEKRRFKQKYWSAYKRVNAKFAKAARGELSRESVFWIHDYHLALVPELLRSFAAVPRIGFFWHIPFPDVAILGALPYAQEIIAGLLASDVIGFHTRSYAENFLNAAEMYLDCKIDRHGKRVEFRNRTSSVVVLPLGVDVEYFESLAVAPTTCRAVRDIRSRFCNRHLAVSVDRVDYTKGLLQRLAAFDALFESWPELRGKLSLLQVAAPSREAIPDYRKLNAELRAAVARINLRHADGDWQPVLHVHTSVPQPEIVAYYQAADLALVTPLIDGMNLVAKEYVASQRGGRGALILSQYAGAADILGADAILVDPYSPDSVISGIRRSLELTDFERVQRMRRLRQSLTQYDVHWWAAAFLKRLSNDYSYPLKSRVKDAIVTA